MEGYALVTDLKNATEDVLSTGETFVLDDTAGVFQLCFVLEKILNNGLKDLALFGKTSFWEFLEHLDQCLPGTTNILNDVRECSKTPLGRGRVFIRVACNEGSTVDYLKALVWNRDLAKKYYRDNALIRNDQYFALMLSHLETLASLRFSLVVKDSGFDDPAYYDKMALELVMSGQRAAGSSATNFAAITTPSAPSPRPNQAPTVSPTVPQKSQPQAAPIPTNRVQNEAQLSPQVTQQVLGTTMPIPQASKQAAPIAMGTTAPKETTEKKKSPQSKRKPAARARTIIEDTSNEGSTKPASSGLKSAPSVFVDAPEPTPQPRALQESKTPLAADEPPVVRSEPALLPAVDTPNPPQATPTSSTTDTGPGTIYAPIPETVHIPATPVTAATADTIDTVATPTTTAITPASPATADTPTAPAVVETPVTPGTTSETPATPESLQSISDSELVPVKLPTVRSPYSTTDTDSVFSSAEMLSSQTSTPSFTAVTDDTDFSPMVTPDLRSSTNTMSPKLTLHSEGSSLEADLSAIDSSNSSTSLVALEPSAESTDTELVKETPETTQEQTQAQESTPEPSEPKEIPFAQRTEYKEEPITPAEVETPQPAETSQPEPEHQPEPELSEPKQLEPEKPVEPEKATEVKHSPERGHTFRPPTPTIGDFAQNEFPIDQPTYTKPLPPTLEPPKEVSSPKQSLPPLIENLKREVYAALAGDLLIREADSLLSSIESILSHGIRAGALFSHCPLPLDQVWSFVRFVPSYLPGTESLFEEIRSNREIESDMGRARSWMRAALNHLVLGKHLKVLFADHKRTMEYYEEYALLRSYEHQAVVLVLFDALASGRFRLQTHDQFIDVLNKRTEKKAPAASVPSDKTKKRVVSQRRKKASIENTELSGSQGEVADEEVLVTRRRGSSGAKKRPNFLDSGELSTLMSSTTTTTSTAPLSNSPPSGRSSPASTATSDASSRPESPILRENGGTNADLPPMPDIPTSQFVPIAADLFQQLQQLPSTPPNIMPAPLDSSSTFSSAPSTPASDSPPAYTSLDDLPRTIPFGVPEYEPDFGPSEPTYTFNPIDIPRRDSGADSFFKTPMSASFMPTSSMSFGSDVSGNTPLSYSYSASASDDSKVTVTDDFLRARLSENYEPRSMRPLDMVRPNGKGKKGGKDGRRASLSDIDSDEGSNAGSQRFVADESFAALPTHYILDVTRKVQRNVKCPGCGAALSHGLFSTARLCAYNCAYYCGKCHVGDEAVIPARLVHQLDLKPYPVCSEARGHIHQYYRSPQLDMKVLNPAAYRYSSTLEKAGKLRRQLKYLGDYVKTCRNKESLLNMMDGRQYMLDSLNVYSLRDLIDAISGQLLPFMYNIMEKFIAHVTKTCMTCKGKGFYCEYCNSGDLLFSWMVLRSSDCKVCPQCKSLSHTNCYKKGNGNCPKCKRIASLKTKTTSSSISFLK